MVNEHLKCNGIEARIEPYGVLIRTIPEWFVVNSKIVDLYSLILDEFLPEKCIFEFRVANPIARYPPVVEEKSPKQLGEELTKYLKRIGAKYIETKISHCDEDKCFVKCIISKETANLLLYSLYLGNIQYYFEITGIAIREKIEKENNFSLLEYENSLLHKLVREQGGKRDYSKIGTKLANISDNIIFHDRGLVEGYFYISNEKLKKKFIEKLDEFAEKSDLNVKIIRKQIKNKNK